ncbi:MAG: metallophosphoesterase family protein [Methanomicrobiales archaeon]|nr:metallophosphoesterase family protein [Methanomicrobiales archaeon]
MNWVRWFSAMAVVLLIPAASATIVWGPYVTNTTADSTTINWKATGNATGWVEYSPRGGETACVPSSGDGGMHRVHLTGLLSATTYSYRVVAGDEAVEDCRFRTFGDQAFTCIIYGDSQGQRPFFAQTERHGLVAERMAEEEEILFVIHTGDFVGDESEWDEFFAIAGPVLRNTTLVPVAGNHDGPVEVFPAIFGLPIRYSFDADSLHVTVLDSNDRAWADMKTQTAWLEEDLASPLPRKIVAFHHPPFSSDRKHPGGDLALRAEWSEIFSQAGVDAVFSGHTHTYERYRAGGTEYFVVGCGGGPFYPLTEEKPEGYQAGHERTLGYVRATVCPGSIDVEMVAVAEITEEGEVTVCPPGTIIDTVRLPAGTTGEWWSMLTSPPGVPELSRFWR